MKKLSKILAVLLAITLVFAGVVSASATKTADYKTQKPDTSKTYSFEYRQPVGSNLTYILDELAPDEYINAKEGMAIKLWIYVENTANFKNSVYLEASSDPGYFLTTGNADAYQTSTMSFKGASVRWLLNATRGYEYIKSGAWNEISFTLHDATNLSKTLGDATSMSFSNVYQFYRGSSMEGNIDWTSIKRLRICYDGPAGNVKIAGSRISESIQLLDKAGTQEVVTSKPSGGSIIGGGVNTAGGSTNTASTTSKTTSKADTSSVKPAASLAVKPSESKEEVKDTDAEDADDNEATGEEPVEEESKLPLGAIIGIIAGIVVLLAAGAVAIILLLKKRNAVPVAAPAETPAEAPTDETK